MDKLFPIILRIAFFSIIPHNSYVYIFKTYYVVFISQESNEEVLFASDG